LAAGEVQRGHEIVGMGRGAVVLDDVHETGYAERQYDRGDRHGDEQLVERESLLVLPVHPRASAGVCFLADGILRKRRRGVRDEERRSGKRRGIFRRAAAFGGTSGTSRAVAAVAAFDINAGPLCFPRGHRPVTAPRSGWWPGMNDAE